MWYGDYAANRANLPAVELTFCKGPTHLRRFIGACMRAPDLNLACGSTFSDLRHAKVSRACRSVLKREAVLRRVGAVVSTDGRDRACHAEHANPRRHYCFQISRSDAIHARRSTLRTSIASATHCHEVVTEMLADTQNEKRPFAGAFFKTIALREAVTE